MDKAPTYTQAANKDHLVEILCRDCGKTGLAELDHPYPGKDKLKNAEMFVYGAKCLRCGYVARDNYNWSKA